MLVIDTRRILTCYWGILFEIFWLRQCLVFLMVCDLTHHWRTTWICKTIHFREFTFCFRLRQRNLILVIENVDKLHNLSVLWLQKAAILVFMVNRYLTVGNTNAIGCSPRSTDWLCSLINIPEEWWPLDDVLLAFSRLSLCTCFMLNYKILNKKNMSVDESIKYQFKNPCLHLPI